MNDNQKDNRLMKIVFGFVAAAIVAAIAIFLFSRDPGGISGAETLGQEGASFWIWAVILTLASIASAVYGYRLFIKNQKPITIIVAAVVVVVLLAIAWGKGCTDKANDGVTTEHGRPLN